MVTTDLGRAAIIDQAAATSADLAVPKCKIWTARPRIAGVADNRASAFKTFNAAAGIDLVVEDSAGIASAAVDFAAFVAAGSGADDEN